MGEGKCPLCGDKGALTLHNKATRYFQCHTCRALFMNPCNHLPPDKEKERYLEHNNDVNDPRYQSFVAPIVNTIMENFTSSENGLDFGSGTGPVITKLLRNYGYNITTYDPYFDNKSNALKVKYNYIACCEVIEHFHRPYKEFALLRSLLNRNGMLICMTELYDDNIEFSTWYYKDDPTHVFFYQIKTLEWIKEYFQFSSLTINNRLVVFTA